MREINVDYAVGFEPVPVGADVREEHAVAVPLAPSLTGEGAQPRAGFARVQNLYGISLQGCHSGEAGAIKRVDLPRVLRGQTDWEGLPATIFLLGIDDDPSLESLYRAGVKLGSAARGFKSLHTSAAAYMSADEVGAFILGFAGGFDDFYYLDGEFKDHDAVNLLLAFENEPGAEVREAIDKALVYARATAFARRLAATPSNIKNPRWVARAAQTTGGDLDITVEEHGPGWIESQGMGALQAVASGSVNEPRFVVANWNGGGPRVALVGKGITFDTGGISLKPTSNMKLMKTDMSGAAAALAAVVACAQLGVEATVTAVLPLAENTLDGASYRPGDIVRTYRGTTVEISNTDAEGRMVLADALAWAQANLLPDYLLDIATLTGAATAALGRGCGAFFSDDGELATAITRASARTCENIWRMPLEREYRAQLDSEVADIAHAGKQPGGGAITAALFLREFTGGARWAHLDIAGPARSAGGENPVESGEATGFGARLLAEIVAQLAVK